jgi:hypothetical protein
MKSLAQRSARSAFPPAPLATVTEPVADRVRSEVDRMAAAPGNMGVSENEFEQELELGREVFILCLLAPEAVQ